MKQGDFKRKILNAALQQMAFLFSLIILGYVLMKGKFIPQNSEVGLSKLENYLFIPAFATSLIDSVSACVLPVAMLITGMALVLYVLQVITVPLVFMLII